MEARSQMEDTIMTITLWLMIAVLTLVIASLVAGVISMANGGEFDEQHSEHFMFSRVGFQALAVLVLLIIHLAYMN